MGLRLVLWLRLKLDLTDAFGIKASTFGHCTTVADESPPEIG